MDRCAVLFVDDDENVLKSLEIKLKSEEYDKYFANSVEKAIEILTITDNIYVVVSDWSMPEAGGSQLFSYIEKYYPSIEKIILTVHTDTNTILNIINSYSIAAYIKKPWKYDTEFIPAIRSAIANYKKKNAKEEVVNASRYEKTIFELKRNIDNKKMEEYIKLLEDLKNEKSENQKLIEFILKDAGPYIQNSLIYLEKQVGNFVEEERSELEKVIKKSKQVLKNFEKIREYLEKNKVKESIENDRKILVVDDSKENRQLLANIIHNNTNYKVIAAKDAYDVLKLIGKPAFKNIGLILLDIMMPGIDGFKLADMLKRNENSKEMPIVFISAMTDLKNIAKAYEKGAYDYISKPINKNEVIEKIKKYM